MLRFYDLDIAELGGQKLSWRRLAGLIESFPADSATARSLHGDESIEWTLSAHLLAVAVDVLNLANWQRGFDKKKPTPKPDPIPRPGLPSSMKRQLTNDDIYARLLEQRRRHRKG